MSNDILCLKTDVHRFDDIPKSSLVVRIRCYLSPFARHGWLSRLRKSPCPRIIVNSIFKITKDQLAIYFKAVGGLNPDSTVVPTMYPQVRTINPPYCIYYSVE